MKFSFILRGLTEIFLAANECDLFLSSVFLLAMIYEYYVEGEMLELTSN